MKYILSLILFFIVAFCKGQSTTTIRDSSGILIMGNKWSGTEFKPFRTYDTLPCYLLVSNPQVVNFVYWIEGYTVYQLQENNLTAPYKEKEYLDEKKKPLPDYLIVWISKIKH